MLQYILMLIVCLFFTLTLQEIYQPRPEPCLRKRGEVWWETFGVTFEKRCEINPADGEECGVCGRPCFTCYRKTTTYPACWHKGMGWKFDIIMPEHSQDQHCITMDHCKLSYLMKDKSMLEKICGHVNGSDEKRGKCKSVYGTYTCECKEPYQGRDCNDVGPKGAYAAGVQVLLSPKVRVSTLINILIAAKEKGNDMKVLVNTSQYNSIVQITEPIISDLSSEQLIKYCYENTDLNGQCETYLKGSTFMYSIALRFPLKRDFSAWYYEDKETKTHYPIGYNTTLTITTTNTVNGLQKESFFRTHYDRSYIVFVQYPIDIECYKNVKIVNCEELQEELNAYDASKEILLIGSLPETDGSFNETISHDKYKCSKGNSITWKLCRLMANGKFVDISTLNVKDDINFAIKPYLLETGMYRVDFIYTILTQKTGITENFDQCFIDVVQVFSPLVAIIEGGTGRYVDVDTMTIVDGSRSYDPNLKEDNNKLGLNFKWSCIINQTENTCLNEYFGSSNYIKVPPSVLEPKKEYIITLYITKEGRESAYAKQTLYTGSKKKILSIEMVCVNCMEGNIASPTEYIYLLVKVVLKEADYIESPLNYTWTFSTSPDAPIQPTTDYRVNQTSEYLLKVERKKLKENESYKFRAAIQEDKSLFSEIEIRIPQLKNFTCYLTPDSGVVATTNFTLNCSKATGLTYEVYDKLRNDSNYYSGRMLFTSFQSPKGDHFTLANNKVVVYGYNKFKMIQEWDYDVTLTPFSGNIRDIDDMVLNLEYLKIYPQKLLHSASVIPSALTHEMDWSSINLLRSLISVIYQVKVEEMRYIKLVLSSLEFILVVLSKSDSKTPFKIQVEEAKMCASIIHALARNLFNKVEHFDVEVTLTETVLHQMINSHLNVIEIVLSVKNAEVLSKPLYLVNPYILHLVKDTTYDLVEAFYRLSNCLLWRQIQGDSPTEIISFGSKINQWAMVNYPKILYQLRTHNESILFNFSLGFYKVIKNLEVLGIQVTNLNINPFWWAGGDINTNILLVDLCFKITPTRCKYQRTFYKAPIFLYFNISKIYSSIKPLDIYSIYLNRSKSSYDLDLDITVYRFDPPIRGKLLIQFELENSTENYKVVFSVNRRPDIEMMEKGVTVNYTNQQTVQFLKYIRDDDDKLYYMGIIPANNGSAGQKKYIKLKIVYAVCKTWLRWKWGNQRCWVGEEETNDRTLRCDCNHLSMFAAAVHVPSYTLNPSMQFLLFLTEEFNWIPLIVLIIILLICLILYVWGWCKDRKDSKIGFVTVLEDNYPGERVAYLIGVYTGSRMNSSTSANVGIKLFGDNGKTRAHILKHSTRSTFRGNSDDWFLLYSPAHLGTLKELYIWHDNSGKSPDWFIENVEVYDLTDKLKYIFKLNIWLALGVNEYPEAVVATSSVQQYYSVRHVFLSNVVTGFRDTNYWTSIFWKHARNPVRRVQRISVVLCFIMVAMMCSILVYHFNKGKEYKEDEPFYNLNYGDFIIFAITFPLASVTACLSMFLFRKSYSHRDLNVVSSLFLRPEDISKKISFFSSTRNEYRSQTDVSKDLEKLSVVSLYDSTKLRFTELSFPNPDEKFIRLGIRNKLPRERRMYENFAAAVHAMVRGSSLTPIRLPKYKSSVVLKKKYLFTAWCFFLVVVNSSAAIVILFGHRILRVESKKWLTTLLCVLLFDALILSSVKILLCSAILGCVFQRVVPVSNYHIKAEDGMNKKLYGNKQYLFKLAQIRRKPMYLPLNENLKELYRQKCIRKEQWKTLIDFLVVLIVILILVMLNSVSTVNFYRSNVHASWMLTQGPSYKYQNFTNIYNRTLYTNFIYHNFVEQLHRYLWYNQEDPLNDNDYMRRKSWTYDCTMRLLGNVRIRQLRVILGECADLKFFEDIQYCSPPWSPGVEDTGTYSSRWYIGRNDPIRKISAWKYTDTANSNSSVSYGITLTKYPSGGFIGDLKFEKDDTEGALAILFSQHWLDHATRAVFVELTLYNVNTRLFTQVILVAEQMPTGEYLVAVKTVSVATNLKFDIWKFSFGVFFIFLLVRMCVLINRKGLFVYFSKIINIYEIFVLALGFVTFLFYLIHIKSSSDYVQEFQRSGIDDFFNFLNIISYSNLSRTALCTLFVCLILRMLISFRFGRVYFTLFYTLLLSMPWIVWLVVYFILYLVVVRKFIAHLLNVYIFPYRTTVIIYNKDFSASAFEDLSFKVLVYLMCLSSYVLILLFIASFAYYYKVAKVYKLIDTDKLHFFILIKETIVNRRKNK